MTFIVAYPCGLGAKKSRAKPARTQTSQENSRNTAAVDATRPGSTQEALHGVALDANWRNAKLQPSLLAQVRSLVSLLPSVVRMIAAEVAVSRRFLVDGSA